MRGNLHVRFGRRAIREKGQLTGTSPGALPRSPRLAVTPATRRTATMTGKDRTGQ
jgi:hypothetical protein